MKRKLTLLAALSGAVAMAIVSSLVAQGSLNSMDMGAMKGEGKMRERVHRAVGTVTKVAPAIGVVLIAHEPVTSLNWPAMTMTFAVRDEALFDRIERGDGISFEFVKSGNSYAVTRID